MRGLLIFLLLSGSTALRIAGPVRQQLLTRFATQQGPTFPPARAYPERRDNVLERAAILVLSVVLSRFLTTEELRQEARGFLRLDSGFNDFVGVTKLLLRKANGNIEAMQERIVRLLNMLVPSQAKRFFKETYATNARLICEQSSEWIARFGLISWLIGSEVERFSVTGVASAQPGAEPEAWMSGLEAKQCRYLLESGCKSACINICKIPTQAFFNDVVGLPLRMTPDFETGSCKFEFGMAPLPRDQDPVFSTPCYLGCAVTKDKGSSTQ